MSVRIIHTADVHLDAAFGRLGEEKGGMKRLAIRGTFSRIVDDCLAWPADVLLIAGDLFEDERVTPSTIGFLQREFARLGDLPVVISPGNHDPFTSRSPYAVTDWGPNVHVFKGREVEVVSLPKAGLEVHGLAHVSTHMEGRLTEFVKPVEGNGQRLLLCHASLETAALSEKPADDRWLPFTTDDLPPLGYDYIALGHYHDAGEFEDKGSVVAAYSGSPEATRASEEGRRSYARVTLDDKGARVETVGVSEIDFVTLRVPCDAFETADEFVSELKKRCGDARSRSIATVRATGHVAPGFDISGGLPDEARELFFHVTLQDETVPAYDWEAISAERSLKGEVARRFAAEMDAADEESRATLEKARLYAIDALEGRPIEMPREVRSVD